MNGKEQHINNAQQVQAAPRKRFSSAPGEPPSPVYANAIDFIAVGSDIYMDVGVITPEAIIRMLSDNPANQPTVDVTVLYRFGMTLASAKQAYERLGEMIKITGGQSNP